MPDGIRPACGGYLRIETCGPRVSTTAHTARLRLIIDAQLSPT